MFFNDLRGELVGDKTKRQLIIFSHTQKSRAFVNIFYVCVCVLEYMCVAVCGLSYRLIIIRSIETIVSGEGV